MTTRAMSGRTCSSYFRIVLAIGVVLIAQAGCATRNTAQPLAATTASHGDSLRIGTYNVQFLPWIANTQPSNDNLDRSRRISDRILASGYDIIALNEVFSTEARETFVKELAPSYPHYIAEITNRSPGQDSGLMLFSKFPFLPLPSPHYRPRPGTFEAVSAGVRWLDFAFIEFNDSADLDSLAAKGVALVRVKTPHSGRALSIVFTHMQASYPDEEVVALCRDPVFYPNTTADRRPGAKASWFEHLDIRRRQLEDVHRIIVENNPPKMRRNEDVIFLGDLNIDGDQADPDDSTAGFCRPNRHEWETHFNSRGEFFTDTLKDAWTTEHPRADRGLTNYYHWVMKPEDKPCATFEPETGARLDYILRNRVGEGAQRLVVQHMTRAFNLRDGNPMTEQGLGIGGINDLSDHIGLNADLNRWSRYCNPVEAYANPPLNTPIPGTLVHQGSMQWYRFDQAGTYAFRVGRISATTPQAEFRVYEADELSVPMRTYFDETIRFEVSVPDKPPIIVEAKKFHITQPPFFVRVFDPDRTRRGPYTLIAHRATCTSKEEACVLEAGAPAVAHVLPLTPPNVDDTTWFEFHLERATGGSPQTLRFLVENFAANDFEMELRAEDGATVLAHATATLAPSGGRRLLLEGTSLDSGPGKRYLVVKRNNLAATGFSVSWDTNLTVFHGVQAGVPGSSKLNVFCIEETDTIGLDELYLSVIADGTTVVTERPLGEFDDGRQQSLEGVIPVIRYVNSLTLRFRDEDDTFNGTDDIMTTVIPTLPAGTRRQLVEIRVLGCCGGTYVTCFNRSKNLQTTVP